MGGEDGSWVEVRVGSCGTVVCVGFLQDKGQPLTRGGFNAVGHAFLALIKHFMLGCA